MTMDWDYGGEQWQKELAKAREPAPYPIGGDWQPPEGFEAEFYGIEWLPKTPEEYSYYQKAIEMIVKWNDDKLWGEDEAVAAIRQLVDSLKTYGITPDTYLYEHVEPYVRRETEIRAKKEWESKAAEEKWRQDWKEERYQKARPGIRAEAKKRLEVVKEFETTKERDFFERMKDVVLKSDMGYEDKRDFLLSAYYSAPSEAMLPESTPMEIENMVFATLPPQEQARLREQAEFDPRIERAFLKSQRPISKQPQYGSIFEQTRREQQPQDWQRYFESNYSRLLRQYQTGLPEKAEPTEKGWADYLKKPELRAEYEKEQQRYQRPWAFAPRIQTVSRF